MHGVVKLWLLATAIGLAGAMIWTFAPVLVPLLGLAAALGGLAAIMIAFARWIERRRGNRRGA